MPAPPHTPAGTMTATQAAHIASRARKLLRAGRLSHHAYAVLDALLWAARAPGADSATASYTRLQGLAHVARATVASAVAQLEQLGLVQRLKRRALVLWNNGGRAWRQLANCYRLLGADRCEFSGQGEYQKTKIIQLLEPTTAEVRAAQSALAAVRRAREGKVLLRKEGAGLPA